MRLKKEIYISNIIMDRFAIDTKAFVYAQCLHKGATFPPIKVAKRKDGQFEIRDGRHRIVAHKLTGRRKILAKFSEEYLRCANES